MFGEQVLTVFAIRNWSTSECRIASRGPPSFLRVHGERQCVFDHHVNAARRGGLDNRQVLRDGAEGHDGFGLDGVQHALEAGVQEAPSKPNRLA